MTFERKTKDESRATDAIKVDIPDGDYEAINSRFNEEDGSR
jgi:hypothetical protein